MDFLEGWDTKLIEMLENCDAGDKAIITGNTTHLERIGD